MSTCGKKSKYVELVELPSVELNKYEIIVLFFIDGLGYKRLEKYGKESFLYKHILTSIHSVYPSTTSVAVTTFASGETCSDHWITSWDMYSDEVWEIIQTLAWRKSLTKESIKNLISMQNITNSSNFYKGSTRKVSIVTHHQILNSVFNAHFNKHAECIWHQSLQDCIDKIIKITQKKDNQRKYIYAYRSVFDTLCHDYGIDSPQVKNHFTTIDNECKRLFESVENKKCKIIITADHGQLNYTNHVNLKKEYPKIYAMLSMPLAWEPRNQFCFVNKEDYKRFYDAVSNELSSVCEIYSKTEVLEKQLFWYWKNDKFLGRIGDFVLIMRKWWLMSDRNEEMMIWNHGWDDDREVKVPVICS